jgi:hypothetical protein
LSVEIRGINEALAPFKSIESFLSSKKPMRGFCDGVRERILEKTEKGQDYMSRKFKPYSKAYAKRKGSKHVNLRVTGRMLTAIKSLAVTPDHGKIWIQPRSHGKINADMLANIHSTGTGKQPQREFMNISATGIGELVKKHYNDPIKELARGARTWQK